MTTLADLSPKMRAALELLAAEPIAHGLVTSTGEGLVRRGLAERGDDRYVARRVVRYYRATEAGFEVADAARFADLRATD